MPPKSPTPNFIVKFLGKGIYPERIQFRHLNDTLNAVQRLAIRRSIPTNDENEDQPHDLTITLLKVVRGSAQYVCITNRSDAVQRLRGAVSAIRNPSKRPNLASRLISPLKILSKVAETLECEIEIWSAESKKRIYMFNGKSYELFSKNYLLRGETTLEGKVMRVGGAGKLRCALRIPRRPRLLYCDVPNENLIRELASRLYDNVTVHGIADFLQGGYWRIVGFEIQGFNQRKELNVSSVLKDLYDAGGSYWDDVDDPTSYIQGLRG